MIIPIKHKVDWWLVRQKIQAQINKYNIRKNRIILDYDCKVGDKVMLNNKTAYKREPPYKEPYEITRTWTNGTITIY